MYSMPLKIPDIALEIWDRVGVSFNDDPFEFLGHVLVFSWLVPQAVFVAEFEGQRNLVIGLFGS